MMQPTVPSSFNFQCTRCPGLSRRISGSTADALNVISVPSSRTALPARLSASKRAIVPWVKVSDAGSGMSGPYRCGLCMRKADKELQTKLKTIIISE